MTLDSLVDESEAILPHHKEELKTLLKGFPDTVTADWFYKKIEDNILYQSDVFSNLTICFVNDDGEILSGTSDVMLLSHTCDVQPDRQASILVATVIDASEYKNEYEKERGSDSTRWQDFLTSVKKGLVTRLFYLPEAKGIIEESMVDFCKICSVSSRLINNIFEGSPTRRSFTLSQYGYYLFLLKLCHYLARYEGPEVER